MSTFHMARALLTETMFYPYLITLLDNPAGRRVRLILSA
jgi:hypothetical protein